MAGYRGLIKIGRETIAAVPGPILRSASISSDSGPALGRAFRTDGSTVFRAPARIDPDYADAAAQRMELGSVYNFMWGNESQHISLAEASNLAVYANSGTPVYVRADSEFARLAGLLAPGVEAGWFVTPDFPIVPYGHLQTGAAFSWVGALTLNGAPLPANQFEVYPEMGAVRLTGLDGQVGGVLRLAYTVCLYGVIASITPMEQDNHLDESHWGLNMTLQTLKPPTSLTGVFA